MFDGTHYAVWSRNIRASLMNLGFDIWRSIIDEYQVPTTLLRDIAHKNLLENNVKDMYAIICSLLDSEFEKVMHYGSTQYVWDNLQNIYEMRTKGESSNNDVEESHLVNEDLDEKENAYSNENENEEMDGEEDLEEEMVCYLNEKERLMKKTWV